MRDLAIGVILIFLSLNQSFASVSTCKSFLNKDESSISQKVKKHSNNYLDFLAKIFKRKDSREEVSPEDSPSKGIVTKYKALKIVQSELNHIYYSGLNVSDLIVAAIGDASEALIIENEGLGSYSKNKTAVASAALVSESINTYFQDLDQLKQAYVDLNTSSVNPKNTLSFNLDVDSGTAINLFSSNPQLNLEILIRDLSELKIQFMHINARVQIEFDSVNAELDEAS